MKKNLIESIFTLFAFSLFGCSQNANKGDFKKEFFPNGKIKSEVPMLNGKKNGIWTFYYENGQIEVQVGEKDDMENGYSYHFYPNGILKSLAHYSMGVSDGDFVWFNEKGELSHINRYSKNILKSSKKFDSFGNIIKGSTFFTIDVPNDTIKLGESFNAKINLNFVLPNWISSIAVRIDSTKKDGGIYTKIGDKEAEALYHVTPKEVGEYIYHIWGLNEFKNGKDSVNNGYDTDFTGKYWVIK